MNYPRVILHTGGGSGGGGDPDDPRELPLDWVWNGSEFTERIVLACIGLKCLNLSSNQMQDAVEWIGLTVFNTKLPKRKTRKGAKPGKERRPYFPSASTIDSYDGVAGVLCDLMGAMKLMATGRNTAECGGDRVLDNHIGLVYDGVGSNGAKFQSMLTRLGEFGNVTVG